MLKLTEPYNQLNVQDKAVLYNLCGLAQKPNMVICEIGCWMGHSTILFAKFAKKNKGKVFSIDTFGGNIGTELENYAKSNPVKDIFIENIREAGFEDYVVLINHSSDESHSYLENESIDLLFIDGDHRYSQVKRDIENYSPKVRKGGIIAGHDLDIRYECIKEDYSSGLEQDSCNSIHVGVSKAVHDSFKDYNHSGSVWWVNK